MGQKQIMEFPCRYFWQAKIALQLSAFTKQSGLAIVQLGSDTIRKHLKALWEVWCLIYSLLGKLKENDAQHSKSSKVKHIMS